MLNQKTRLNMILETLDLDQQMLYKKKKNRINMILYNMNRILINRGLYTNWSGSDWCYTTLDPDQQVPS